MKQYVCDNCQAVLGHKSPISLRGIPGDVGHFLIPDHFLTKHFCKADCFWDWIAKQLYNPPRRESDSTSSDL